MTAENLERLRQFLEGYNSRLAIHPYEREGESLISSESAPSCLHGIKSRDYEVLGKRCIKTTLIETPDKGWIDFYILFHPLNVPPVLMGHIARVFPQARDKFQEKFIDSLVLHLMALGNSKVARNTFLFPDILVPHVRQEHYDMGRMQKKLANYKGNPVAEIICNEKSPEEKTEVFKSLKLPEALGSGLF